MKTKADPRHIQRQKIISELFEYQFRHNKVRSPKVVEIISHIDEINEIIHKSAPKFTVDKIYHIDLAVLQLAVFELNFEKTAPVKVIIDEAVELAKEYGNDTSPGFINGVLGSVIKNA
ncbi:MAG: transcription antitermination factor NusB [Patescibacteria group bacterium]